MAIFVLVHGACVGGPDWKAVLSRLTVLGHQVLTPDLPGMGRDCTPLSKVSLESWAGFIASLVSQQTESCILVGHSRGGIVISQAAEYVPEKVKKLVYLAGMLVPNGMNQGEVSEWLPRSVTFIKASEDGTILTVEASEAKRQTFNTTPSEVADSALASFGAEPAASFAWRLSLSDERYGRVPRVYVETYYDNAIPVVLQRMMHQAQPCEATHTLMTDHFPEHCAPQQVADLLHRIALSPDQPD